MLEVEEDVEKAVMAPGTLLVEALPHSGQCSWWLAAGHILTAFLGPGILAMPYIMSRLGWVASITALLLFFFLTLWTSGMLADVYQVDGKRHGRYDIAVRNILGKRHGMFLVISQHVNLVLSNVGFQIAAADACSIIVEAVCRTNNTPHGQCWGNQRQTVLTVVIGVMQLLLSQMKNLQTARVSSAVGGAAAVIYCIITFALAASKASNRQGSVAAGYDAPASYKVFAAFNALGAIGFDLNVPIITLEVADTLKEPPTAAVSMKKSLWLSLGSCLMLFGFGGVLGYLALGDGVGENFLLAFQDTTPAWVLILGSVMIVLNMVPAYQVCGQPTFAAVEDGFLSKRCCSCISRGKDSDRGSASSRSTNGGRALKVWLLSLVFRSAYVACTTLVAVALPFFAAILGLVAAMTFYQTAVLYPMLLHRAVYPQKRAVVVLMNVVLVVAAAVTIVALVGSVAVVAMSASLTYLHAPLTRSGDP